MFLRVFTIFTTAPQGGFLLPHPPLRPSLRGMKTLLLTTLTLTLATTTMAAPATPQQTKMKTCAAAYHSQHIAKSQYRTFMKSCLKKGNKPISLQSPSKPISKHASSASKSP